jgi:hypothetical protein
MSATAPIDAAAEADVIGSDDRGGKADTVMSGPN